ncbi:MAG: TIGR03862 family flavoprotein [Chloroflexi bacterium]|nr:TIGR03862 family flavoprotein [Chloroflexota bacterium]
MSASDFIQSRSVAVVGGGPAGLMAAEVLIQGGVRVDLYDSMPSVGRKFLVAGKGGLNLTHAESREQFHSRYGTRRAQLEPLLDKFGPEDLRRWVHELGTDTFVGTSGRVFPVGMKTAPILRAWLLRLSKAGVTFHMRHKWCGWSNYGSLLFETPDGEASVSPSAVVLALGGGSWARLGSTGAWVPLLVKRGVAVAALKPSNCGFDVAWSEHFRTRFEGFPLKSVIVSFTDSKGNAFRKQGEFIVTATGVEGSLIYAISAQLRDEIEANGSAIIKLDLAPGWSQQRLMDRLSQPRGSRTLSVHLEKAVKIKGVKAGLLREFVPKQNFADPKCLASAIKELPIPLIAPRPLDEAISSAGGVLFDELDEGLMIRSIPGVFCAGEMLDWEAPTGGYLLTACFASGRAAGLGTLAWLDMAV